MTDRRVDFVAEGAVRWPEVTKSSWLRMLGGVSESTASAWRNGHSIPRLESQARIVMLAELRVQGIARFGEAGFSAFLYSRPNGFDGQSVVTILSLGQVGRVLDHLRTA